MSGKHRLRGVLIDVDGVLYDADRLIVGGVETAQWLQKHAIPHLFVTNTTSKSRAALAEKLLSFGIPVAEAEILAPAIAASEWLRINGNGTIALFVRPSAREEFRDLPLLPEDAERGASYVVLGDLGELWDYRTLNRAFRLLYHNPEARLIALGMTRYWLASSGVSLDVAPFVAALEHATGRKALVFGKPAAAFFRMATKKLGLPARVLDSIADLSRWWTENT
jgi:phospholysine phosphohistidine inorganic pyrophosphate phosphatase